MEREIETVTQFVNYLINHGYPKDSIILEWPISKDYRVDLAVIDPKSKKPVAIVEFKHRKNKRNLEITKNQLKRYAETLGDPQILTYAVFSKEVEPYYELFSLTKEDDKEEFKEIPQFPTFTAVKNVFLSKEIEKTKKEEKNTINDLKLISWGLAFVLILLLGADLFGYLTITAERLTLIGLIIAVIVIPYAGKLKVLGVEFERLKED